MSFFQKSNKLLTGDAKATRFRLEIWRFILVTSRTHANVVVVTSWNAPSIRVTLVVTFLTPVIFDDLNKQSTLSGSH